MATDPAERMRLVASFRGNAIGLVQPGVVIIIELPKLEPTAELGTAGDLDDNDVGYAEGGLLAVLSRAAKSSTLHVIDPRGPTKLGDVELRTPTARIAAIAGDHLLLATTTGNTVAYSVVDAAAEKLAALPLPVRGTVTAIGRVGVDRFLLAVNGQLEEWDAVRRAPGRRLRVDHNLDPLFVGGNAQQVWLVPKKHPDVIEVISLAARSTKRIELPEAIAALAAHPNGYLVATIGAATRNAFVIDTGPSKAVARVDGGATTAITWLGRTPTLVIKPVGTPMELVTIGVPGDAAPPRPEPEPEPDDRDSTAPSPSANEELVVKPAPPRPEVPPTQWSREDIASRLAAWRAKNAGKATWSDEALGSLASTGQPVDLPPPAASTSETWTSDIARRTPDVVWTANAPALSDDELARDDTADMNGDINGARATMYRDAPLDIQGEMNLDMRRDTSHAMNGEMAREMPSEMAREMAREVPGDMGREMSRDTGREMQGDTGREMNRDLARDVTFDLPRDISRPIAPDMPRVGSGGGWRADLARWTRAGGARGAMPSGGDVLDTLAARLAWTERVRDAVALLYGAYLGGVTMAPVDLAATSGWEWSEALGGGELAATGLVKWRRDGVWLRRELVAALDERAPLHGVIVDGTANARDAVAVVAPASVAIERVAAWATSRVGRLLVPHDHALRPRVVREARVRGARVIVRANVETAGVVAVVETEGATKLPVVATWSA